MTKQWTILPQVEPLPELKEEVGGHPLVARLLAQRGITTSEAARAFLDPDEYIPSRPLTLQGMQAAGYCLQDAIVNRKNILVWGDFDVDGQTSTSLLVAGLRQLVEGYSESAPMLQSGEQPLTGARAALHHVRFHVPNRFNEGHGIKPDHLQVWLRDPQWRPDVLLTCDTGIAEGAAVSMAKEQGLTVVVTDHHDIPVEFYDHGDLANFHEPTHVANVRRADAIINPKLQPKDDPLSTLPGVGVAYKLIQHLFSLMGRAGEEIEFLDLVALGIVADVAEQVNDARYLLQRGLQQLRVTRRHGLLALMDVARLTPANVNAEDIGFQLGPRMNALGRLEDATVSVELLTTRDAIRAGTLAAQMERLNQQRRLLTSQMTATAMEMLERTPKYLDYNAIVLTHPAWHPGIVGIVASRLVEEFNKPTVLLLNPPGKDARGSARSIPGVDIGSSIAGCSHLLIGHGGHPGAAGVTLEADKIDAFRRELSRQIDQNRNDDVPTGLMIDAELPLTGEDRVTRELAEEIDRVAPFGQGNPTPQFISRGLNVVSDQRIGQTGAHRRLTVQSILDEQMMGDGDPNKYQVLWFNGGDVELPAGPIDLVYTLNINEFRGKRTLQLMYIDHRAAERLEELVEDDDELTLPLGLAQGIEIHDLRGSSFEFSFLPPPEQTIWYAEGPNLPLKSSAEQSMNGIQTQQILYAPRTAMPDYHQTQRSHLVLWNVPPSPNLLTWLLDTTKPHHVYLCARITTEDRLDSLVRHVASMCKYAINKKQPTDIERMAARLGTTETVIRHSLLWLHSSGHIRIVEWGEGDQVKIANITGGSPSLSASVEMLSAAIDEQFDTDPNYLKTQLQAQLAEVRAYRRFFQRAKIKELGIG
ncbi:MAG: DHHA1 domain-containing protein [Chloroflexota bacterium]